MPQIDGVTVRRPNAHARGRVPVRSDVELASGKVARYQVGTRQRFALSWRNVDDATAEAIDLIGSSGAAFPYVDDVTERSYLVLVEGDGASVTAVPGTYPVRYDVDLTLVEQSPR